MSHPFEDIVGKLGQPVWYDVYLFPRYCPFHPDYLADKHVAWSALMIMECAVCEKQFSIAKSLVPFTLTETEIVYPTPINIHRLHRFTIQRILIHIDDRINKQCVDAHHPRLKAITEFWRKKGPGVDKDADWRIWWE